MERKGLAFCLTVLAPEQMRKKINMTFKNRKNAEVKGPLNGCEPRSKTLR